MLHFLMNSLSMLLLIKGSTPLTGSAQDRHFLSQANSVIKKLSELFRVYFFIFITDWQHTIIITKALLTNDITISFDHPLYNLFAMHHISGYLLHITFANPSFSYMDGLANSFPNILTCLSVLTDCLKKKSFGSNGFLK